MSSSHTPPRLDKRILKSKHAIEQAFIDLLKEEDYSKITITKITEHAGVNRGTFYKHYTYKEDILKEVRQSVLDQFTNILETTYIHLSILELRHQPLDTALFAFVYENRDFFHLALHSIGFLDFQNQFCDSIKQLLLEQYFSRVDLPEKTKNVLCGYISYGFLGILVEWDKTDYQASVEDVTETTRQVLICDFVELKKQSMKNLDPSEEDKNN